MTSDMQDMRDEIFREAMSEYAAWRKAEKVRAEVIVSLLRGGSLLFGNPIEIHWPEGQPYNMSNAELADLIDPQGAV